MIVECPGCNNRYDVTGRPAGTHGRCRCGTVFEFPHPDAQAGSLCCPQCGGNVAATNHQCEYCSAQLLLKACPRCFARIFHGAKHCSHCGANVVVPAKAAEDGSAVPRSCPRCLEETEMVARLVQDVLLDECPSCHGIFVDVAALERILAERRQARADAILGLPDAPQSVQSTTSVDGRVYVKCPDCDTLMNRQSFASGAGVVVDVCRNHGTWFDADELPRIVDFVMKGGLERAARRDSERDREQARRQDSIARATGHSSANTSSPFSHIVPSEPSETGFSDLLHAIARFLVD